jgi:DNA-binding GntR family transcriptional regulator
MKSPAGSSPKQVKFQRQPLAGQVADELRRQILTGVIVEGTQLMQEQLASEFGISKVPVREALFQLEAEGFVVQQFHRGAVVSGLSPAQLMELFELRAQIEAWLLELAMTSATEADVERATAIAEQLSASDDPDEAWDLNWRFHEALYRPAAKPFAVNHLMKLHSQTARYVRMQYAAALNRDAIRAEHEELLALYARKDPAAVEGLREHILHSARQLTEHLIAVNEERAAAAIA